MTKIAAIILAGGQGTRFWPVSRRNLPKQFLDLLGDGNSLIQTTAQRLTPLVNESDLYVVTNAEQKELVLEHLPSAQLIVEPCAKNTTAAIGLAAFQLAKIDPKTVMIVLPADHYFAKPDLLLKSLNEAVAAAQSEDVLVTLGITPTSANTAYGYIAEGKNVSGTLSKVKRFYEKPNKERAERYLTEGGFFWNSGMFVWRAEVILAAIKEHSPEIFRQLSEAVELLNQPESFSKLFEIFSNIESISIDFSVLEHAKNVMMIKAEDLGWSDVGSWDSWAELLEPDTKGNVTMGEVLLVDSRDCIIRSDKRLLAVLGVENLVVVDFENASLICSRERVQDVKLLVEELKRCGKEDLI